MQSASPRPAHALRPAARSIARVDVSEDGLRRVLDCVARDGQPVAGAAVRYARGTGVPCTTKPSIGSAGGGLREVD